MGSPALSTLFTYIAQTAKIPMAVIIPIYKNGMRSDPTYYHPISLLCIVGKLYVRHVFWRLWDCIDGENLGRGAMRFQKWLFYYGSMHDSEASGGEICSRPCGALSFCSYHAAKKQ